MESPSTPTRIYALDLLRFLSALSVMLFHYFFRGWADGAGLSPLRFPMLGPWFKYGYLGVDLFFIISGFVIMMTAMGKGPGDFVKSRVLRLFPAFWICCTLTFGLILIFNNPLHQATWGQYAMNMTLLPHWIKLLTFKKLNIPPVDGVYWSLYVEMQFYLFMFLLITLDWLKKINVILYLWLGLSFVLLLHDSALIEILKTLILARYSGYFTAGIVFYLLFTFQKNPHVFPLLGLSFVLTVLYGIRFGNELALIYHQAFNPYGIGGILALFFLLFFLIATRRFRLDFPFLAKLGDLTYPLYLIHQIAGFLLLYALYRYVPPLTLVIGLCVFMSGVAYLIAEFGEKPLRNRLKKRLYSSQKKRVSVRT